MRLRIDLAYDGTDFRGWATQLGLRTVQHEVEQALAMSLRSERMPVVCAGRTDAGVHARGQVLHVDVDPDALVEAAGRSSSPPPEALARRLNGILPADVHVRRIVEAPDGFDARFSALWRRYAYRVADSTELLDPLTRRSTLAWPSTIDLDLMNDASARLLGRHDFAAFCRRREGATTIRTLLELDWSRDPSGIAVANVKADAFCHSMVRSLVGLLLPIGDGRRPVTWADEVLAQTTRRSDVTVAPAHGLTLEEVCYPVDVELGERAEQTRARRIGPGVGHE
ncbi:MAG: tRNA pseudouridine(38-40) synthase TruA [Actinobacteria bacterium]|uniref:Unannotated protein n=1 Tax=freshwater metagenome TaxID=449393 RepID=A0A6J6QC22_9ZZZZ|nr:tRNA pseudouridine(38-40) synthase TruA [Actinomycetota bacterium]